MNGTIRELKEKDAAKMFLCLSDKSNLKYLTIGYKSFSLEDCLAFIKTKTSNCKHYAIIDEEDNWCGTISLKNIDDENKKAEYAIITDNIIHGTGLSKKATDQLIHIAFDDMKLHKIYLNVISENHRAISFYKKCGFDYIGTSHHSVLLGNKFHDLEWFELLNWKVLGDAK